MYLLLMMGSLRGRVPSSNNYANTAKETKSELPKVAPPSGQMARNYSPTVNLPSVIVNVPIRSNESVPSSL